MSDQVPSNSGFANVVGNFISAVIATLTVTGNASANLFTATGISVKRLVGIGTALTAGNFAIDVSFGVGAAVSLVRGTDQRHSFTVTAGVGPTNPASLTMSFADGAFASPPQVLCLWSAGNSPSPVAVIPSNVTTAAYTIVYPVLLLAGNTASFTVFVMG